MSKVYVSHNNIVSALGFNSATVVQQIHNKVSGLQTIADKELLPDEFCASLIDKNTLQIAFDALKAKGEFTRLEKMMLVSLQEVIKASKIELNDRVGLIISTTKGNIDVLDEDNLFTKERAYLSELGKTISNYFGFKNDAIVVSNACVSGVLAVSVAKRYINQGKYDHIFVVGGDLVTPFILSGFNSFQALSSKPCKPYDKNRVGINIGEVATSALITKSNEKLAEEAVEILGEGSCNDANHISGPSRTGEGLYRSMKSAFAEANISSNEIDYLSAHGTATPYNDEMEAIAFDRMDLSNVPMNSLKGYFGHTLGASGLLETVVGMHSLYNNTLYASLGFEELGVSKNINVIRDTEEKPLSVFLKTASGFGGCNTAAIFKKVKNQ